MVIEKFKNHITVRVFGVIFGIICFLLCGVFIDMIIKNKSIMFSIGGIFFCLIMSITSFTLVAFSWIELFEDYYIEKNIFPLLSRVRTYYKNVTYISRTKPGIVWIHKLNIPIITPPLKEQEKFFEIILQKNPNCRISEDIAKFMKKKLGRSFDEFIG